MVSVLSVFSLIIFSIASLSFLLLAYVAIRNDPKYKVNQLFSLAFIFAFFYFIFMGLYVLPAFVSLEKYDQYFALLGLIFINLSIATFAFVSQYIQHANVQTKQLIIIFIVFLVGLFATYLMTFYFNDLPILFLGFTLLNIALSINSIWFVVVLYIVAKKEKSDMLFKKKVNNYNIGFILFNILSVLGWTLALFSPLSPELAPLPPGILTLIASFLMARSFLMKAK